MDSGAVALVIVALIQTTGVIVAARRSGGAKTQATEAKVVAEKVSESVGDANGQTIAELVRYQHDRNHDILDQLAGTNLRLDIIGREVGARLPALPDAIRYAKEAGRIPADPNPKENP